MALLTSPSPVPFADCSVHNEAGYPGGISEALRSRELYKYYQPPSDNSPPTPPGERLDHQKVDVGLEVVSSEDPTLSAFALLTANLLNCKRSMISLVDDELVYLVAESTRSLSLTKPYTHDPGDGLWVGGRTTMPRGRGLCERTISLVPPEELNNGEECIMIFELEDMAKEPEWEHHPNVSNWPYLRYYAGAPLRTKNGVSIGSICVVDDKTHPGGLEEEERRTMAKMAEIVMEHLERVRAENEMKRGKMMGIGMSRFVAANFLQAGAEFGDVRNDGRLRSIGGNAREEKVVEAEQLAWADAIRGQEPGKQDRGYEKRGIRRQPSMESHCSCKLDMPDQNSPGAGDSVDPLSPSEKPRPGGVLSNLKPSQLPLSFPSPDREDFASPEPPRTYPPELSRKLSYCSQSTSGLATFSGNASGFSGTNTTTPSASSTESLSPPIFKEPDYGYPSAPDAQPRYRDGDDVENSLLSTFGRASALIRSSLEADGVAFVDCDLGRNYGFEANPEDVVGKRPKLADAYRDQKPSGSRRKSGLFGYATASSSSLTNTLEGEGFFGHRVGEAEEDLPFSVEALSEPFLHSLVDSCPQGRIFTYGGGVDGGYEAVELECDIGCSEIVSTVSDSDCTSTHPGGKSVCKTQIEKLKEFLPGSRSIVFVPLYDFDGNLFAVGFAWSNSKTRVFCKDIEGTYMIAFGNSIMAEIGRLHSVSADRAKGDFISSVSHELRSPLHGILASAEFLSETDLDNFQRSFVDTVESCGRTLLDTINHVLDFSKLNSFGNRWDGDCKGRLRYARDFSNSAADVDNLTADTDLSAILEEVTEGVFAGYEFRGISTPGIMEDVGKVDDFGASGRQIVGTKNDITVIMDIDRREDGWVFRTQPGALRRIFLNLGGNAIKYTDSGWVRIKLRAEDLPPSLGDDDEKSLVTLVFTDSGKGISREFLKTKLFTPFSQENPLVSGTGLGMSIVRQIVEMLGGEIDVKSELGKGTEVTVSLVLKKSNRRTAKPDENFGTGGRDVGDWETEIENIREKGRGKKVRLFGFDSPSEANIHAASIFYLGCSFSRYISHWFGMTPAAESSPCNISSDFIIAHEGPRVEEHLARQIRGLPGKEGGTPLIVICSNASRHETYQSLCGIDDGGIVYFVSKPCGPRKLAKALAACIEKMETTFRNGNAAPPPLTVSGVDSPRESTVGEIPTRPTSSPKLKSSGPVGFGKVLWGPSNNRGSCDTELPIVEADCDSYSTSPGSICPALLKKDEKRPETLRRGLSASSVSSTISAGSTLDGTLPTALIVEDNPVNLMLLATFMKKRGYPFEKATNGLEALRAAESRPGGFDIILMDLQMPIMSGIESTRAIRRLERQSRAKGSVIIALTGLAAASDKVEAYEAGIDLFMVKPVSFKQLESTMREYSLIGGET
ncbi:unnamed protein product [Tuber melanosporum]|uniref:histidine kinase n=1 Tax=Tuber melanosporum (strain Mel28) TaxID=656061 RepID=D5GIJ2_TUBMM|nr:uncharacterized protein GSTUM_00008523001 [Tuber melanosporum]CAZ84335.1 unnamed protein product [Tuber melanosporum]